MVCRWAKLSPCPLAEPVPPQHPRGSPLSGAPHSPSVLGGRGLGPLAGGGDVLVGDVPPRHSQGVPAHRCKETAGC